MNIGKLSQGRVNSDQAENEKLDMNARLANVEQDVVSIRELFIEDLSRRKEDKALAKKRDDYIDRQIKKEEEEAEIRREVMKKLLSNTAWFGFVALCGALWWMLKEALRSHS